MKKELAYGADVLRLWAASVEFTRDMSIGPTVLSQCAESYRKIRNAARFILGNSGDRRLGESERVPYAQLPLVCVVLFGSMSILNVYPVVGGAVRAA